MPMEQVQDEPWHQGTEVVALYNFPGRSPEDLAFQKGDLLIIQHGTRDKNWYKASDAQGRQGMIPANYVQPRKVVTLHAMPWFHGKISRQQAEDLLKPRENGLFLIRESNNYPGDYTLCVCHNGKVEHYRILYRDNQLTIDEEGFFKTLDELVKHYLKDADGLCTQLTRPVTKQGGSFGTVSLDEFKNGGWVINQPDVQVGEIIGKGAFGDVYKGEYKGQPVAIKQLKDKDRGEQSFLQEASVMTTLRHDNLVRLIGVVLGENIFLVTEFMGKGNLVEYLRSRGRSVITKKDQINFATDTCAAMEYLESKNLVHRDLAARNVLINDNGMAKVSDFGLAKFGDFSQSGQKFPIKWTAPEALRENNFTTKSDMWSFGILLWEIYAFGRVPYPRIPLQDVVVHVERGYRMEAPEGCPPEIYTIMKQAWELDPERRPTFRSVLGRLNNLRSVTV
ncbi:tyrosine-protein kinase CSK-like isoform X2 [Pomacea canaliculata]|uniref:tyrosine-protein kinase CSK-like isoform X2 n=1 Tax=Pomacea canaliculata TaxID=400727 RepID=UPI000D7274A3|nr:tyrosine-protein kinase CSK-like isoform X2 [Pomacea canaliculata]